MSDLKITQLTENTTPALTDLSVLVDDPAGTPLTQKITLTNLLSPTPLLAGRTGGQTLIGGTDVTYVLKLQGTSGNGTLTSPATQLLVGDN